jgi:hypothetical protein
MNNAVIKPSLFGLKNSNRDFSKANAWGKNQFNSSFPAALCCYLAQLNINANYIHIKNGVTSIDDISVSKIFGTNPLSDDIHFAFESVYLEYSRYIIGSPPRTDLVVMNKACDKSYSALEVKLTALPDNTTHQLHDGLYGSEIVVRPDSIVYLACSIAKGLSLKKGSKLLPHLNIKDWSEPSCVLPHIALIAASLKTIAAKLEQNESPFLLQPIWKTKGKSSELSDNCLDVFVWSDAGFVDFIHEICNKDANANRINRQTRTAIWLFKMLADIQENDKFNAASLIDRLSFNTKNDKAFASSGYITNKFMSCARLEKPIIQKGQIKEIILGDGQNLLSPERRFDALLVNSPELFL